MDTNVGAEKKWMLPPPKEDPFFKTFPTKVEVVAWKLQVDYGKFHSFLLG